MFARGGEKTAYTKSNKDYSKSQIDVQITGQQGLEWYLSFAEATIKEFMSKDPSKLSEADIENVTKAAAIAETNKIQEVKISDTDTISLDTFWSVLGNKYGIRISQRTGKLSLNGKYLISKDGDYVNFKQEYNNDSLAVTCKMIPAKACR